MLYLVTCVHAELRSQGRDRFDRVFDHYRRFIALAVSAGEIPSDIDQLFLADFIRDLWQGNLHDWVMQRRPKSLEASMLAKLDFLFDRISD